MYLWRILVLLFVFVGAGCNSTSFPQSADAQDQSDRAQTANVELVVFAAASLTNALQEVADLFMAQREGVRVVLNFAGSSQLALQILEGAPADIFASADEQQMQRVVEAGRVEGPPSPFATNRLTVIVPADNRAAINTLEDLAKQGVLLVVAAPGVPVREYTNDVIGRIQESGLYGETYQRDVFANIVSEEENVRQVVAKIVLGEADAGIVYSSDVTPELAERLREIEIPDAFNVVARYPVARIEGPRDDLLVEEFLSFLNSSEGQAVLARWGFGPAVVVEE